MFTTAASGIITVGGEQVGGHAIDWNGVNTKTGWARLKNSWDRSKWGKLGHGYIRLTDLEKLLFGGQGEACLAIEVKR